MIKRVIGVMFTLLVFVVVLLAALEWGSYRSLFFEFGNEPVATTYTEPIDVEHRIVEQADSVKPKAKKSVKKSKATTAKKSASTAKTASAKKSNAKRATTKSAASNSAAEQGE